MLSHKRGALPGALGFLLATFVTFSATGQLAPSVVQAPPQILTALRLNTATMQDLTLPATSGQAFQVNVVINGVLRTLQVQPNDVRSPNFKLFVDGPSGLQQLPTPPSVTYQGAVAGDSASVVAATLVDSQLSAYVQVDGVTWGIEPASRWMPGMPWAAHVVYRGADTDFSGLSCGTISLDTTPGNTVGPAALKEAEIACDADIDYYIKNGSNTTTTTNTVTGIINGCNVIYRRDVGISYKISTIIVRTTRIYVQTSNMNSLLVEFQNYWNANHGAVVRDLTHLFTGAGSFSGVIGIAYLGVVCNIGSAYGVSKAFSSLSTNVGLVCHETGHNWNANHCDGSNPCNIMCSGLGGCSGNISSFDPVSIAAISAWRNAANCLTTIASAPPTITSLAPTSVATYPGGSVVVTGTELDSVTSATVGSQTVTFTIQSSTRLTLNVPSPSNIGTQAVIVTNNLGSSNSVNLQVNGVHPAVMTAPAFVIRNFAFDYKIFHDLNQIAVFFVSTSLTPSVFPGYVTMGIGNNFAELIQVAAIPGGLNGFSNLNLSIPNSVSPGQLHWQGLVYNPANIVLPFEVSNVKSVTVL